MAMFDGRNVYGCFKEGATVSCQEKGKEHSFVFYPFAGVFLVAGTAVRMGASASCEEMKKSLTSGIVIQVKPADSNEFYEGTKNENGQEEASARGDIFTQTELEKILDFEGVSGYYTQWSGYILYAGLETAPGRAAASLKEGYYGEPKSKKEEQTIEELNKSARLQIKSLSFHPVAEGKWEPSFLNGALNITEGRNVEQTDQRKAVISESIAEKNGLKVGDTITARNYDFVLGELYGNTMEFEIVGIYRMNFKQAYSPENTNEDMIMENVVFCDREIIKWCREEYHEQYGLTTGVLVGKAAEEWFSVPAAQEEYRVKFDMERDGFEIHKEAMGPVALRQAAEGREIAALFGMMFLAVMGAALYSSSKIVNQKPKEILMKR